MNVKNIRRSITMNLFFGKISSKKEKEQIEQGYYRAVKKSSWFNGIEPGDYSFTIGGGKIQLWKAKEWSKKDGDDILQFDIIHNDLKINTKKLTAIKYFDLTMEMVVLTVRSTAMSKKAFFPIPFFKEKFTEQMLLEKTTYTNPKTFRNIHLLGSEIKPDINSSNVQLYLDNKKWRMFSSSFVSSGIIKDFHDNTDMLGSGQKNKDKTIRKVIDPQNNGKILTPDELSILQIYDLFCCDYKRQEIAKSVEEETDEVNDELDIDDLDIINDDSGNFILYGPPGTGKTFQVLTLLEELDTNARGVEVKSLGKLKKNNRYWHLAPGRGGYLWDVLKNDDYLGYEWCHKDLGDLKILSPQTDNYNIRKRFSEVKKGGYFCIIRGRQCLAIAEALEDYDYEKAKDGPYEFQTVKVKWHEKFKTPILLNSTSTMTFSGVGQRWEEILNGLEEKGFSFEEDESDSTEGKPVFEKLYKFTTFHQSYSYEDFVEGIKPRLTEENSDDEEEQTRDIEYEIKPGIFYNACDRAAQLAGYSDLKEALKDNKSSRAEIFSKAQPYYLIIDEINRGNVANILGELITLIERDKRLGAEQETIVNLPYSKDDFGVPSNLILIGTMNTADRSIEALDSALRRRFTFIEKAPEPELLAQDKYNNDDIDLKKLLETINSRIEVLLDKDHLIGHSYFMSIKRLEDIQVTFKNKIIPLLEEYFFGKPHMIGLILGKPFLKEKDDVQFFSEFDTEYSDLSEKKRYEVVIPENWEDYRNIYARI